MFKLTAGLAVGVSVFGMGGADTGTVYESRQAYYESSEYRFNRDFYLACYERILYTVHETTGVQAVSNGPRHYDCLFAVAGYHIGKNGVLDYMRLFDFELCDSHGNLPDSVSGKYREKDAAIAVEFYRNQQGNKGEGCYKRAIAILQEICLEYQSDFYLGKAIWYHAAYGMAELPWKMR